MTSVFPHSSTMLWDVQSGIQTLFLVSVASSASGVEKPGRGEGLVCEVLAVKQKDPSLIPRIRHGSLQQCASAGVVGKQVGPGGLLASQPTESNKLQVG